MSVYLIHFAEPYHHAKHYLGWSPEVQARFNAHLHGKGARLTQVVHDNGIGMMLVRVWEDGDRKLERKLKNRHSPQLCPICSGQPVQTPLLPWMPAYVPEAVQESDEPQEPTDGPHSGPDLFDLIDYDGEADDLAEDMLDREFWSRGAW